MIFLPVVVGPTASGKTAVAVELAREFDIEVVSADSRQIFRGMEIGTGAPTQVELSAVRHHLVGQLPVKTRISAGEFARLADTAIDDIIGRGKQPVVAGGSGLYIRALTDGLSPLPGGETALRAGIERELDRRGMAAMLDELRAIDPDYAVKVGLNDRKRLVRAFEVIRSTGQSFSGWHARFGSRDRYASMMFGLELPRRELHDRIERRIKRMFAGGWIDEVEALIGQFGGAEHLPATVTDSLGYREIADLIAGHTDRAEAVERIIIRTRRYAKRQITWFRADRRVRWLHASGSGAETAWAASIGDALAQEMNRS